MKSFTSLNQAGFNLEAEKALLSKRSAVFSEGFLAQRGVEIFENACDAIERREYSELCEVMIANKCNKSTVHNYTQVYHRILDAFRGDHMEFVEIGIGTPNQDVPSAMAATYSFGASLRAWRAYLKTESVIHGGDVDPRVLFEEDRISTCYINQLNPSSVLEFVNHEGLLGDGIDVMLDDGLHEYRSNMCLLLSMWPHMKTNGIYLIEDMSEKTYNKNLELIESLALNADGFGFELPSEIKSDNRIIALQKR